MEIVLGIFWALFAAVVLGSAYQFTKAKIKRFKLSRLSPFDRFKFDCNLSLATTQAILNIDPEPRYLYASRLLPDAPDLIKDALSNTAVHDPNDEDSEMWLKYLSILPFFQKITVGDRIAFDDIFNERDPESNNWQMFIKSQAELMEMQSHIKNLKALRQAKKAT
jgi:hypothetical protein